MIRFEEVQAQVQARILDEVQARISAVNKPLVLIALPAITAQLTKGEARIPARTLAAPTCGPTWQGAEPLAATATRHERVALAISRRYPMTDRFVIRWSGIGSL
jgi:hypothetical protein